MNYYLDVLKKYAVFEGRASLREYWMFFLINILITIGLNIVTGLTFVSSPGLGSSINLLSSLYFLAVLIPNFAVAARRLHDTNRSGWWQLIALIPLIGAIALLVFLAKKGEGSDNQYGPVPQAADKVPLPPQA